MASVVSVKEGGNESDGKEWFQSNSGKVLVEKWSRNKAKVKLSERVKVERVTFSLEVLMQSIK